MTTYDPLWDSGDTLESAAEATLTALGYTWNRRTTTFSEYLAIALSGISGSSYSNKRSSTGELLAELVNELGSGPVSHLTSSRGQLLALLGSARPSWVPAGATTVFDFANGRSYFNGSIDTLSVDSSNFLVTGNSQTNIVPYAGDLRANVTWGQGGLQNSSTGIIAPDGTATAFKIEEQATTERHVLYPASFIPFTIAAGETVTGLFALKAAERSYAVIGVQDTSFVGFYAYVDLANGTIGSSGGFGSGGTLLSAADPLNLGDGWWLFSITGKVGPASTGALPTLDVSLTLGNQNYAGTAGSGIYAWVVDMLRSATGSIPMPSTGLPTTAQPTTQLRGTSWTQLPLTGANALTLSGGVYTNAAASGQQAGYFTVNENDGQDVTRLGATWKFTNVGAGSNGAATLVIWKNEPISTGSPVDSGMHLAIGRSNWVLGKIIGGNPVETIDSGTFSTPLSYGVPLTADVRRNGNTVTYTLPDGSVHEATDPDIGGSTGPWATIEAFQNDAAADDRTGFYKAWFK